MTFVSRIDASRESEDWGQRGLNRDDVVQGMIDSSGSGLSEATEGTLLRMALALEAMSGSLDRIERLLDPERRAELLAGRARDREAEKKIQHREARTKRNMERLDPHYRLLLERIEPALPPGTKEYGRLRMMIKCGIRKVLRDYAELPYLGRRPRLLRADATNILSYYREIYGIGRHRLALWKQSLTRFTSRSARRASGPSPTRPKT